MGFMDWFKRKQQDPRHNYTFVAEDTEQSVNVRAAKKRLELLKIEQEIEMQKLRIQRERLELQQTIDDMQEERNSDDTEETEQEDASTALIKALIPMFTAKFGNAGSVPVTPNEPFQQTQPVQNLPTPVTVTDEQIRIIWDNTPKLQQKYAKQLYARDLPALKALIRTQMPLADELSQDRALAWIGNN